MYETYWVALDKMGTTVQVGWETPARLQYDDSKAIRLISEFNFGDFVEIYQDGVWLDGTLQAPPVRVVVEIRAMVEFETFEDVSQGVTPELAKTKVPFGLHNVEIKNISQHPVAKPRKG